MSRWWRAYDEAVDDPKLILLGDKAHRAWFNLMCIASLHEGVLPDIKIVAVKLRLSPQRAAAAITELVRAGLFDQREDGRFEPHNWNGRQYKSDVTDQNKNRKRTLSGRQADADQGGYSEEFEAKFWQPYPRSPTMSKSEAWRAWLKLTRSSARHPAKPSSPTGGFSRRNRISKRSTHAASSRNSDLRDSSAVPQPPIRHPEQPRMSTVPFPRHGIPGYYALADLPQRSR
jgi:hypothetical protein